MKVFNFNHKKTISPEISRSDHSSSIFMGLSFDAWLRLLVIWFVIISGASGLGWRLYQLQIKQEVKNSQGDVINLPTRAKQQQTFNFRPYIPRRSVIDARNNVVGLDKVVYSIYVHPIMLNKERRIVAEKLAQILPNQEQNQLVKLLNSRQTGVLLGKKISEEQAQKIRELGFNGFDFERRYARFYPQEKLFADILGYVNTDHSGQAGIEYSQERLLQRSLSQLTLKAMTSVKRDGQGAIIPNSLPDGIVRLDDQKLKLTLDLRLQRAVRESLQNQIQKFNAKRGVTIVMDVHTGEIIALACEPTYDPNKYSQYDFALFKNWAVTDSYEPGSTFKPINVAIALDEAVIKPNSIVLDAAAVQVDGWPISNASKSGLGWVSVTRVLEVSSNTGMIHIMRKIKREKYYQRLKSLGLDELIGVDMPFEATGYLKPKKIFTAREIETAVSAFGQGLSLTPLKLVQLHAALANGGMLVTPHIVKGLVNAEGELEYTPELESKRVFSEQSAQSVVKMMQSVVENGSGRSARIDGYHIGGKTGTAQKHDGRGRYQANAKITSFVSIFPSNEPRYVILTAVDEPKGANTYGSTVAAPVVKEVIKSLISIKGIPPAYPMKQKENK